MSSPGQDIRYALRGLRRNPGFTAVAVVTLALAIGANTTLFSLLDAVLLRALPFKDPSRLVEIWGQEGERSGMRVPAAVLEALRARSATLERIAIHGPDGGALRTPDGPVFITGRRVSANYIELMGISPLAGRGFLPEDENPGAPAVMIVSYGFWQRRLGGDPEAIGRTLYMDEVPYTVVGIMPPEFQTAFGTRFKDFWTPYVTPLIRELERKAGYELVGRLVPGVTLQEARRELRAIATSADVEGWKTNGRSLGVVTLKDEIVRDSAYVLQLLMVAVAAVLAIACANLALLALARSDRRIAEFATRKAIGAPSSQLFRLALMESLLLSALGGVAGVALAHVLLPVMLALAPSEIPRIAESTIDWRVLNVALLLTLLTGCAFGLMPALRLSRLSVVQAMKGTPGAAWPQRLPFRSALIVGQVAASVTLFVATGLIGRTFLTLLPSNPGFETESRTVFLLNLPSNLFSQSTERLQRLEELVRRLEALPGVTGVGLGSNVPFGGDDGFRSLREAGRPAEIRADVRAISPNFFQLFQMPLRRGRAFSNADNNAASRVAIANETLARKLAPDGDVLGRTVQIAGGSAGQYQIVGVVADARSTGTSVEVWNEIYIPYAQSNSSIVYLIVRSPLDSASLDEALRREIRLVIPQRPDDPVLRATSMEDLVSRSFARPRFSATLMSAFSANALLLAAIGVFGLVAYSVSQRRQEFGVRAALGAHPLNLLSMTLRSVAVLIAVGIALGLAGAAYLARFIESQLYAIEPLDPPTFAGAVAVMVVVAGLAAYLPARRAAHVDPLVALRYE